MRNRVQLVNSSATSVGTTNFSGVPALHVLLKGSLITVAYDYVSVTYPTAVQEVYAFKTGGSGGSTVATVTVNYVDSTKVDLLNVGVV